MAGISKRGRKAGGAPGPGEPDSGGAARRLTPAVENYLLSIFMVAEQGLPVTNTSLVQQLRRAPASEGLGTSLPSVAGMLRRMQREGLVAFGDDRGIELTAEGARLAESIVRRHRLAERLVVDMLGLDIHRSHVEAHRLEHAISDELEERIRVVLGNPGTCPAGHPIPGSDYTPCGGRMRLDEAPVGEPLIIDSIPEEDEALLEYLVVNGLVPGGETLIVESAPYRGVLTLKVGDMAPVLGSEAATRVWVCPLTCSQDCANRRI